MSNILPTDYQSFIHKCVMPSTLILVDVSRGRTVSRYMDNVVEPVVNSGDNEENFKVTHDIEQAIRT